MLQSAPHGEIFFRSICGFTGAIMGLVGVTIRSNCMFLTGKFWRKRESTHDMSDFTFSPIRRQLMLCLPDVRKQFR